MLMKQKKMLVLTFSQLKQIYTQEMPELVEMAAVSPTVEDFKAGLLKHLDSCGMVNEVAEEARVKLHLPVQPNTQNTAHYQYLLVLHQCHPQTKSLVFSN